jgi:hypothetical protein
MSQPPVHPSSSDPHSGPWSHPEFGQADRQPEHPDSGRPPSPSERVSADQMSAGRAQPPAARVDQTEARRSVPRRRWWPPILSVVVIGTGTCTAVTTRSWTRSPPRISASWTPRCWAQVRPAWLSLDWPSHAEAGSGWVAGPDLECPGGWGRRSGLRSMAARRRRSTRGRRAAAPGSRAVAGCWALVQSSTSRQPDPGATLLIGGSTFTSVTTRTTGTFRR